MTGLFVISVLPSLQPKRSALATVPISGLNHTAHALAVYASQTTLLAPTQDSLPAGRHLWPGGTCTHWVTS